MSDWLKALSLEKKNVKHETTYLAFGRKHRFMFEPLALYSDNPLPG